MSTSETVDGPGGAPAASSTSGGLFLRRSSGLVREFGGKDVFVFNTIGYALGLVLGIIPLLMAGAVPEANVLLTVALGTVLTVANAHDLRATSPLRCRAPAASTSTSAASSTRPRASRRTGASSGRSCSGSASTRRSPSTSASRWRSSRSATSLDSAGSSPRARTSAETGWTFVLGTAMIVSVLVVLSMGPRVVRRVLNVLFVPAIIGSFVTLLVLLTTTRTEFVSRFNTFMADRADGQTYDSILAAADKAGFVEKASTVGGAAAGGPDRLLHLHRLHLLDLHRRRGQGAGADAAAHDRGDARLRGRDVPALPLALLRHRRPGLRQLASSTSTTTPRRAPACRSTRC